MRYALSGIAFLAGSIIAHPAMATPVPDADVPAMAKGSDLIAVGRVSSVQTGVAQGQNLETVTVTVDRVLKGGAASGPVTVQLHPSSSGYAAVEDSEYGMFFLHRQSGSTYTATDPFHPALPASPIRSAGQSKSADVLSSVAQELANVLSAPAAGLVDPVNGVQNLIVAPPADQAQYVYYEAATALSSIPYEAAEPALRYAMSSNGSSARLWATYAVFAMDDPADDIPKLDYLNSVAPILVNPLADTKFAVFMLANAIEGKLNSPKAVPTLSTLLGSSEVAVRQAAASDLGDIATPDAVVPLAKNALNDEDQAVRYYAVLGLATAAEDLNPPTVASFKEKELEMLAFWRRWAKSHVH